MVDLITKEHHEEAKQAKDIAAGMVLVTALGGIVIGILIFVPHMLHYLYQLHKPVIPNLFRDLELAFRSEF